MLQNPVEYHVWLGYTLDSWSNCACLAVDDGVADASAAAADTLVVADEKAVEADEKAVDAVSGESTDQDQEHWNVAEEENSTKVEEILLGLSHWTRVD